MYACIYELRKNCCGRDGTGGRGFEGSTRGPRGPKKRFCSLPQILRWLFSDKQGDLEYVACTPLLPHLCLLLHNPWLGRLLALQGADDGDLPGQGEAGRQAGRHHWGQLWHWSRGEENYLSPVHGTGCQVEMVRLCSRPQKNKIDVEISVGLVLYIFDIL